MILTHEEQQQLADTPNARLVLVRNTIAAVLQKLAGVSVEPVAWRNPVDSYSLVTTHQKETNEFQYSDEFLAGHTEPLYTAEAIAAARVQALEEAANPTDDQLVKGVKAMRLFVTKNSVADLRTTAAEQGWNAAIDQAAAIVLADCVNPPKTEYQHQYNATLRHTAAQILKLKEST